MIKETYLADEQVAHFVEWAGQLVRGEWGWSIIIKARAQPSNAAPYTKLIRSIFGRIPDPVNRRAIRWTGLTATVAGSPKFSP